MTFARISRITPVLISSALLTLVLGCAHPQPSKRGPSPAGTLSESASPAAKRDTPAKAGPTTKRLHPDQAYVCELQVLITKLRAHGPSMEDARTAVKKQCLEEFDSLLCGDEEDLSCRKTVY